MQVSGTAGVKPTGRIAYLDAAKGCAILSVILSHLWIPELTPFLFSFHLPLFFVLSGYFLKREDNPRIWVCKRARQILVPFALTAGVLGLARLALLHCAGELSLSSALGVAKGIMAGSPSFTSSVGPLWFLPALFVAQVAVQASLRWRFGGVLLVPLAALGYITQPLQWCPMSVQPGLVCALFVYAGYWARKADWFEYLNRHRFWILPLSAVWLFCVGAGDHAVDLSSNHYPGGFWDVLMILAAVSVVIWLCRQLIRLPGVIREPILYCGRHSLMILCLHSLDYSLGITSGLAGGALWEFLMKTAWAIGSTVIFNAVLSHFCRPFHHRGMDINGD